MKAKFHCPKCGRILGDTTHGFDAIAINCPGCHKTSMVGVKLAKTDRLLANIYNRKEENGNKSK